MQLIKISIVNPRNFCDDLRYFKNQFEDINPGNFVPKISQLSLPVRRNQILNNWIPTDCCGVWHCRQFLPSLRESKNSSWNATTLLNAHVNTF